MVTNIGFTSNQFGTDIDWSIFPDLNEATAEAVGGSEFPFHPINENIGQNLERALEQKPLPVENGSKVAGVAGKRKRSVIDITKASNSSSSITEMAVKERNESKSVQPSNEFLEELMKLEYDRTLYNASAKLTRQELDKIRFSDTNRMKKFKTILKYEDIEKIFRTYCTSDTSAEVIAKQSPISAGSLRQYAYALQDYYTFIINLNFSEKDAFKCAYNAHRVKAAFLNKLKKVLEADPTLWNGFINRGQ